MDLKFRPADMVGWDKDKLLSRDALLSSNRKFAIYDEGKWYLGLPLPRPLPRAKQKVWINYSAGKYDKADDELLFVNLLDPDQYGSTWILLDKGEFEVLVPTVPSATPCN